MILNADLGLLVFGNVENKICILQVATSWLASKLSSFAFYPFFCIFPKGISLLKKRENIRTQYKRYIEKERNILDKKMHVENIGIIGGMNIL